MEFCGKSWPVMPLLGHWVTHLHSKILERDPPTLDETLKLACRLETIARWSAAADDNFDDLGRRRDRLARGVGVGDDRGTADMARRIEQLSAAHKHYRGEVENLRERSFVTGRAGTPWASSKYRPFCGARPTSPSFCRRRDAATPVDISFCSRCSWIESTTLDWWNITWCRNGTAEEKEDGRVLFMRSPGAHQPRVSVIETWIKRGSTTSGGVRIIRRRCNMRYALPFTFGFWLWSVHYPSKIGTQCRFGPCGV